MRKLSKTRVKMRPTQSFSRSECAKILLRLKNHLRQINFWLNPSGKTIPEVHLIL